MSLEIKICGLSTAETLDTALGAGADMVGMVFFPPSPRHVDLSTAGALAAKARGRARIVALTVDADDVALADIVAAIHPDMLQLHGKESPERVAAIRARFELPVMKAVGIATAADLAALTAYERVADRLLLDAKPPKDAVLPGGNGVPFDWDLLAGLDLSIPYMLSGGLDPENVREAVQRLHPFGVDVSSGVERAPGVKDIARIVAFIREARAADPSNPSTGGKPAQPSSARETSLS
ncbi:Phosphoribosylanthranilate isomerase [Ancylobacter novellus DSM 506]|uniref:N-(5'-phosphoribosyl)anthranilate isomerase n=1 Tax=Ancylobacter novellus (strain ATCC 8093 / DSM 506 / JCM 20403 / CCM 1077 / IAM 12100 / NBRC 12443 / NCIMB 10456) TaxID=639283 RepID=D6ZZK1_ANCN5|nr:phosphoribosylanthranilate isomerase [Ancylobacter novellus]ADH91196.1 Phosphoribosylanthranilate isomerase [Ancylobacter novellus DSM 506]